MYGYIKVCAATPEIRVADVDFNVDKIICAIKESAKAGSAVTVFPELCVCGYTCCDLFGQSQLLLACEQGVKRICKATQGLKTLVFIGAPVKCDGKLYNSAVAINNGSIIGIIPKTFLPNYGEFYERRNFMPANGQTLFIDFAGERDIPFGTDIIFKAENMPEFAVAAEICEDLWAPLSPSLRHTQAGANIIVNLSCSDETAGKAEYRKSLVKIQSGKLVCGYVYCDAGDGESTTDMVFAGHNLICENGACISESALFENGLLYGEIDVEMLDNERRRMAAGYYSDADNDYVEVLFEAEDKEFELTRQIAKTPFIPGDGLSNRCELLLFMQAKGLEKRLKHINCRSAVIGISGGLDSALALLVTVRAFNALGLSTENIVAVTMPGFGTTAGTKYNSLKLIKELGCTERVIPIGNSVLKHFEDIGHDPEKHDTTYENAQARMRTLVLMDIANETGGIVIGTGDLSELALGWATYNGDHMSMYGVNSSVPKTLVKHLIAFEAKRLGNKIQKILEDILNTEISPELLPPDKDGKISQKTEDLVGPYVLHDFFLYYIVRYGFSPEKVRFLANVAFKDEFDGQTIDKWLKNFYKRFFAQQFKRSCSPDGVKVGSITLSPRGDWRMPSDAVAKIWLDCIK